MPVKPGCEGRGKGKRRKEGDKKQTVCGGNMSTAKKKEIRRNRAKAKENIAEKKKKRSIRDKKKSIRRCR